MIDEDLRKRMEEAYLAGDYDAAVDLSQKLDVQVVKEQRRRMEYIEVPITIKQAKDLKVQGDTIKLRPNTAIINTADGWKVVDI